MWEKGTAQIRRVSKFGAVYSLYLVIVWLFDYVYFPWLTIKFRFLVFIPLYLSIFLVSWGGYYLYEYFKEDVLLTDRIRAWLHEPGKGKILGRVKRSIADNPGLTFAAIATWWSPLHAYLFFRRDKTFHLASLIKSLAKGSLYCAAFWGGIAESILFAWDVMKGFLR